MHPTTSSSDILSRLAAQSEMIANLQTKYKQIWRTVYAIERKLDRVERDFSGFYKTDCQTLQSHINYLIKKGLENEIEGFEEVRRKTNILEHWNPILMAFVVVI